MPFSSIMTLSLSIMFITAVLGSELPVENICRRAFGERTVQDYSNVANRYHEYGENATTDWLLGYSVVADFLSPLNGKEILDYGCGTGKFSRFLGKQGAVVFGVD